MKKEAMPNASHIDIDHLIDYFEEKLGEAQEREIDRLIREDASFAAWVDEAYAGWLRDPDGYREAIEAFYAKWHWNMERQARASRQQVAEPASGKTNKAPARRRTLQPAWVWLAAAACLVGIVTYLVWPDPCSLNDASCIIAEEGGPYREGLTTMSASAPEADLQRAIDAYRRADYPTAIPLMQGLLDGTLPASQRDELTLMLGVALLQTGQPEAALSQFEALRTGSPPGLRAESLWYAALAHLSLSEYDRAEPLLRELSRQASPKADAADRLRRRLPN